MHFLCKVPSAKPYGRAWCGFGILGPVKNDPVRPGRQYRAGGKSSNSNSHSVWFSAWRGACPYPVMRRHANDQHEYSDDLVYDRKGIGLSRGDRLDHLF
jgi:hypothetical protein